MVNFTCLSEKKRNTETMTLLGDKCYYSDKKRVCWGLAFNYLSILFLNDGIQLLFTISEGILYQMLTIRLKKKEEEEEKKEDIDICQNDDLFPAKLNSSLLVMVRTSSSLGQSRECCELVNEASCELAESLPWCLTTQWR